MPSPDGREEEQAPASDRKTNQEQQPQRLRVVGLGASAGGLNALKAFFGNMPGRTGIAFVVVVHLSPEHDSQLDELLQTVTELRVVEVDERTQMQPDHVYIIPPGKNLEITNGHLALTELEMPRQQRAPIDHFFRTLAYAHPDGTGIVLSGGGADGTVGMKAIKEQGGILMAQDPEEAEYPSMPRNAINTGLVDFVLPVQELSQKVLELNDRVDLFELPKKPEALPESDEAVLLEILAVLRASTGHDFSGYKRSTVLRRIDRRMRVNNTKDLSGYLGFLRGHEPEAEALFKDLLISVTNFFRDAEAWEALERDVIPKLFENKEYDDEVRVWVPGCATGEEVYSLAMLLLEQASARADAPRLQVFGSDLDEAAIVRAREGYYPEAIVSDVSEQRLKRFFVKRNDHYQVKEELRSVVIFAVHDLLRDPPFHNQDLITCRNLLIYLERDLQEKVFDVFHYALREDGYLFLGMSEAAENTTNLFTPIQKKHRTYQRRTMPGKRHMLPDMPLMTAGRYRPRAHPPQPTPKHQGTAAAAHFSMLEQHAPPSVLVDANRDILHLSQSAGRYLHYAGGQPTHNLLKAVRKELQLELSTALHSALEGGRPVSAGPVKIDIEGQPRLVYLIVRPGEAAEERRALVLFAESDLSVEVDDQNETPSNPRLIQLEKELRHTKEQLRTSIEEHETSEEELKAANEELQSINEEYKSALEELETSKEELQSVNEELHTVNTELQNKVDELSQANNDLNNLMASTEVATIFLNRRLEIERFTPSVSRLFNIREGDKGRPIGHLTHQFLSYDGLVESAQKVLDKLVPIEREVEDKDGNWHLTRILPYRTDDDRIEGVVITFVDITRLKYAQEQHRQIEERHRLLLERVQEYAIFTMDEDGTIVTWNPGAERIFGYTEKEALGQHARIIFIAEDQDGDAAEDEMAVAAREGQASDERWHMRKDGSRFWGSGVMTALHDDDGNLHGFAKVLRDNTQWREATEALKKNQQELQELNRSLEERVAKVKEKSEQERRMASDLIIAEQDERHRIAQILHDDLQQTLYGIQMRVRTLTRTVDSLDTAELKNRLEETQRYLAEAVEETRNLAIGLSPPVLEDEGLTDAVRWLGSQMEELHNLHVDVDADESFFGHSHEMRVLLFQIVREVLFNVVKHKGTKRAGVTLRRTDDHFCIEIEGDGQGFDPEPVREDGDSTSFGLRSIRERLSLLDGTLDITSAPGEGTQIAITVPVDPRDQIQK